MHCGKGGIPIPEVEDPCYQAIQHDGKKQWDDIENGKVNKVDGQVELSFLFVSTLHMVVMAHLNVTQ